MWHQAALQNLAHLPLGLRNIQHEVHDTVVAQCGPAFDQLHTLSLVLQHWHILIWEFIEFMGFISEAVPEQFPDSRHPFSGVSYAASLSRHWHRPSQCHNARDACCAEVDTAGDSTLSVKERCEATARTLTVTRQ